MFFGTSIELRPAFPAEYEGYQG